MLVPQVGYGAGMVWHDLGVLRCNAGSSLLLQCQCVSVALQFGSASDWWRLKLQFQRSGSGPNNLGSEAAELLTGMVWKVPL